MALQVTTIDPARHAAFIATQPWASYLQTPAWARVKTEWRGESLGWFDADQLVGVGLVLYRQLPRLKRYLAYLPEGPVLDWATVSEIEPYLTPLVKHLKKAGAFGVRIGPPVTVRRWSTGTVKAAIADPAKSTLDDVAPDVVDPQATRLHNQLRVLGWIPPSTAEGFAAGQPRYNFQLPMADLSDDQLLAGMNQLWRRNIKKAAKLGVTVTQGTIEDLPTFHPLYVHTAERDHFTPRPLSYFQTMFAELNAEDPDRIRLYLAHHEGDLVAATTWVRVGQHAWYSFGASSTEKREVRGSNAIQWRMITDARAAGATVYDLRGITDSVDNDDPHLGLIQFKVGTGGEAVEYLGEWDLPINPLLYKAFELYLRRR
ncbi:MAG: lipid II:glycine glycyltransferase FemX [Propionibacteriaceae bacterium]